VQSWDQLTIGLSRPRFTPQTLFVLKLKLVQSYMLPPICQSLLRVSLASPWKMNSGSCLPPSHTAALIGLCRCTPIGKRLLPDFCRQRAALRSALPGRQAGRSRWHYRGDHFGGGNCRPPAGLETPWRRTQMAGNARLLTTGGKCQRGITQEYAQSGALRTCSGSLSAIFRDRRHCSSTGSRASLLPRRCSCIPF
jgi:hypothetical protein